MTYNVQCSAICRRLLANARPRNVQPGIVGVIWMRMRTQLDPADVLLAIAMSAMLQGDL